MFERFTDRARRVVVLAQEEARLLDHNYIGTEHILLGLLNDPETVAGQVLEESGVTLESARRQVEEFIGRGPVAPTEGHIPFTARSKKVLEFALREALELGHNYIGTEHILLGVLREGEGVAVQVLVTLGADLATVRVQVIEKVGGRTGGGPRVVSEDLPITSLGRRLRLRVLNGRITISIDDPATSDLPELDLVVRNPDLLPEDSRAIYQTVRNLLRQLDQDLADLEPHIVFDATADPPTADPPTADPPA